MLSRLLIGTLSPSYVFYTLTQHSKRAKRSVQSVTSTQVLGTSAAADKSFILKSAYCKLLGVNVGLPVIVDTKVLCDTISAKRLPTDKAIKGDVASTRYDFEACQIDHTIWVPGKFNLADPMTKRDSPIESSLHDTLSSGALCSDISNNSVNNAKKPIG